MREQSTKSFEQRLREPEFIPESRWNTDFKQFGLVDLDYMRFLDKQEYESLQTVEIHILSGDYADALRVLDNIMTDCVCHAKKLEETKDEILADMEQSANRQEEVQ